MKLSSGLSAIFKKRETKSTNALKRKSNIDQILSCLAYESARQNAGKKD